MIYEGLGLLARGQYHLPSGFINYDIAQKEVLFFCNHGLHKYFLLLKGAWLQYGTQVVTEISGHRDKLSSEII